MYKVAAVLCLLVCFTFGITLAKEAETLSAKTENSGPRAKTLGLCFDEGLGFRLWVTDDIPLYASVFWWCVGADSAKHQPINTFSFKLGGGYKIFQLGKLAVPMIFEFMMNMDQYEIPPLQGDDNFKRCNLWSSAFRIGLEPEFFINDHFSIGYKFGVEWGNIGTEYRANSDNSDTESMENDYNYVGFFGFGAENTGSKIRFLECILLSFYF